jgi:hypothetical protein
MAESGITIEKVVAFERRGRGAETALCDLRLADDKFVVVIRSDSQESTFEKYRARRLNNLSVDYGKVEKVRAEKLKQPRPLREGEDPITHELRLDYNEGNHFWSRKYFGIALTDSQYATVREFLLNRVALSGRTQLPSDSG